MRFGRRNKIRYDLIPVVTAAGIIPLIMRVHLYNNDALIGYPWFSQSDYTAMDAFLWAKSLAIQVLGLIILILLADKVLIQGKSLKWRKTFVLPAAYLLFVFISALTSDNVGLAFKGSYERFEPAGVIASYLLIFYYSYISMEKEEDLSRLFKWLGICFIPMFLLGILQSLWIDPFGQNTVKRLILPSSLKDNVDNLVLAKEKGIAYLTMYNENYPGMFFAVLIPVFIALFFAEGKKVNALKIISVVFTLVSFFVLYHTSSTTGWLALLCSAFIVMWIILGRDRKGIIYAFLITGAIGFCIILAVYLSPAVRVRIDRAFHEERDGVQKITAIETGDDEIVFYYLPGNELHASFDFSEDGLFFPVFLDENGKELLYTVKDDTCVLDECFAYADAKVYLSQIAGTDVVVFSTDEHEWPMLKGEDGGYYYLNSAFKPDKIKKTAQADILSQSFLSGRGRIWNKCFPLMLKHILLGSGANTFITVFPQDDYVAMNYRLGWGNCEYNVKAHCFFINDWIENGMIADLCMIIFFMSYLINGARVYGKAEISMKEGGFMTFAGLGLYAGCLAYMITALVNDSNVCTAPLFWAALGTSVSVTSFVKNHQNHMQIFV